MDNNTITDKNQKIGYHLKQAKKYRQGILAVNVKSVRADFLAKAKEHERLAHDLADTVETLSPPTSTPKEKNQSETSPFARMLIYALSHADSKEDLLPISEPKKKSKDITPPHFIKVHSKLAPLVLKTKDANLTRAFSIWLVLRSLGKAWVYQGRVIKLLVKETGKDKRTIQRWLETGMGVFWVKGWRKGKRTISLRGKNKVLDTYGLTAPGRVLNVPIRDLLTPKLKNLRACLRNVFFNREKKWASRETIEGETGITPRTQYNYDKETDITPIPLLAYWPWVDNKGKKHRVKSLPNRYLQKYGNTYKKHSKKRFNLRTVGFNGINNPEKGKAVKVGKTQNRLLHDTVNHAAEKAGRMAKKGEDGVTFGIMGKSKKGKYLMVKVIVPEYIEKSIRYGG